MDKQATDRIHNAMRERLEALQSENPKYLEAYSDDFEKHDRRGIERRGPGWALWAVRQCGTQWIDLIREGIEFGDGAASYVKCIQGMGYEICPVVWFFIRMTESSVSVDCVSPENALEIATASDRRALGSRLDLQPSYSLFDTHVPDNCQVLA